MKFKRFASGIAALILAAGFSGVPEAARFAGLGESVRASADDGDSDGCKEYNLDDFGDNDTNYSWNAFDILDSGKCGDNLLWTLDKDGTLTISGRGDMWDYDGTERPYAKWTDMRELKNVVIGNYVTSIGANAFIICTNLAEITIPDSVTSIGSGAFAFCESLTSINIPESVTDIGAETFYHCGNLTDVTIPGSVKSIGDSAFSECTSLTDITLPEGVTDIGKYAFMSCTKLTNITIPNSVTSIGDYAFRNCTAKNFRISCYKGSAAEQYAKDNNIKYVLIDEYVASGTCGKNLSWGLDNTGTLTIRGTGKMDDYQIVLTDSRNDGKIQKNVTGEITPATSVFGNRFTESTTAPWFDNANSIKRVVILDGVWNIGLNAFRGCQRLTEVTIPDSVTEIGDGAFKDTADSLVIACHKGSAAEQYAKANDIEIAIIDDSHSGICGENLTWELDEDGLLVIRGKGKMADFEYVNDVPWNSYCSDVKTAVIENGVTNIGSFAFYNCENMKSISVPDSVTNIGLSAFSDCRYLTEITIPDGVTTIGQNAFNGCASLTEINIPDTVTDIGSTAFLGCTNIKSVTIPDSVVKIGEKAFGYYSTRRGCIIMTVQVEDFTIFCNKGSAAEKYAEDNEFACEILNIASGTCGENLTWVLDGEGTLTISGTGEMDNFYYISSEEAHNIKKVNTPWYDFRDDIKNVVISDGVTSIGNSAFENCSNIESVTIPDGVTIIGSYAFLACASLKGVTVPESVTKIMVCAFEGCTNLTDVIINEGVESIESWAFYDCNNLTEITVPKSVKVLGVYPFGYYNSKKIVGLYNAYSSPSTYSPIKTEGFKLRCYKDTAAEQYAKNYKLDYEIIYDIIASGTCGENLKWTLDDNGTLTVSGSGKMNDYLLTVRPVYPVYPVTSVQGSVVQGKSISGTNAPWFKNADSIKRVVIEDGAVSIGNCAFAYCRNLTDITVPASVEKINSSAFTNTSEYFKIRCYKDTAAHQYAKDNNIDCVLLDDSVASGTCDKNLTWTLDSEGTLFISGTGEMNGNPWYYKNRNIKKIIIDSGVTSIYSYAFKYCLDLESVTIPDSVTVIEDHAFYDCSSLKKVNIPDSVTELGEFAFDDCSGLESVTLPDGITEIGKCAFRNCRSLTGANIPEGVTTIGDYAFFKCTALTDVTIPKTVTTICKRAFLDCTSLTKITVPKSVTNFGEYCLGFHSVIHYSSVPNTASANLVIEPLDNFTICCYSYSKAEKYAKYYNFKYELLDIDNFDKYPKIKKAEVNNSRFRLWWEPVEDAEQYGIACYVAGKWKVMAYTADTVYTSPKLKPGTYCVVVCAKVNGKWYTSLMKNFVIRIVIH